MKKILAVCALCSVFVLNGCGSNEPAPAPVPEPAPAVEFNPEGFDQLALPEIGEEYAVITTNLGVIELRLFPQLAPMAVQNFTTHAKNGYYDGLIFHRIADNPPVIQTGDPLGTGSGGNSIWGDGFFIEVSAHLRHFSGALGMARGEDLSSQGSQFYIVHGDLPLADLYASEMIYMLENQDQEIDEGVGIPISEFFSKKTIDNYLKVGGTPYLDFGYTVFGQVISGMDVVQSLAAVETENSRPLTDAIMTKVEIKAFGR